LWRENRGWSASRGAEKLNFELGDQFLFFAIDHETKVIPAWALGKRTSKTALQFLSRLKGTLNGQRPHISTDDWRGIDSIAKLPICGLRKEF